MNIKIENLTKYYGAKKVLNNVDIKIGDDSIIGLVGPNGAGKSTLMKLMVSQLKPTSGNILIDGTSIEKKEKYLKRVLGYLPQDFGLYEELNVFQFLHYMAELKGITGNVKNLVDSCIKNVNLLEKRRAKISSLSGGQRQRVGIAQALLNNPELLIVDEPTVGLDPEERIKMRNLFAVNSRNKIVIISTHFIDDVQSMCNRIIVMNKGTILYDGTPEDLIQKSEGHVGRFSTGLNEEVNLGNNIKITSKLATHKGFNYRIVGENLPSCCEIVYPSLEDAYMYCILKNCKENIQNE